MADWVVADTCEIKGKGLALFLKGEREIGEHAQRVEVEIEGVDGTVQIVSAYRDATQGQKDVLIVPGFGEGDVMAGARVRIALREKGKEGAQKKIQAAFRERVVGKRVAAGGTSSKVKRSLVVTSSIVVWGALVQFTMLHFFPGTGLGIILAGPWAFMAVMGTAGVYFFLHLLRIFPRTLLAVCLAGLTAFQIWLFPSDDTEPGRPLDRIRTAASCLVDYDSIRFEHLFEIGRVNRTLYEAAVYKYRDRLPKSGFRVTYYGHSGPLKRFYVILDRGVETNNPELGSRPDKDRGIIFEEAFQGLEISFDKGDLIKRDVLRKFGDIDVSVDPFEHEGSVQDPFDRLAVGLLSIVH